MPEIIQTFIDCSRCETKGTIPDDWPTRVNRPGEEQAITCPECRGLGEVAVEVCEQCRLPELNCPCEELEAAMLATAHIMPSIDELRRQMDEATDQIVSKLESGADRALQDFKESVEPTIPLDQHEEIERIRKATRAA